ncbi:pilus assembly protein TadG-related protein [Phenylobacterium sp.]|uniref:pilus assembly protein TadG-related protein n=1 Tax=Phenylobacterium sp. TaxID=1871053 RepID=UPI002FCC054F
MNRSQRRFMRRLLKDRRGTVSIFTAATSVLIMAFAALAVDVGSVFLQSRQLQGIADLAAMAAARDLSHAQAAAQATIDANNWPGGLQLDVGTGAYAPDPAIAPAARYQGGAAAPNAARVVVRGQAQLYFAQAVTGRPSLPIARKAIAARAELASFSIGTRLASLQGGLANQLLTKLTGSSVSLTVMDYNSLVGAQVDLFDYSKALQTEINLQGASFDKVLDGDISTGTALSVLADVLDADGEAGAATAARKLATAAGEATPAELDRLIDLGPYGAQDQILGADSAKVELSAMEIADALLLLAQEGRQVKLDLAAGVPGLADVDVWLAIGERPNNSPWIGVDRDGDLIVRTAQTRLYVEAKALGALGVMGLQPVKIPVLIEAASGEAKLASLECPDDAAAQAATLFVRPGIGTLKVGQIDTTKIDDFTQPLTVSPGKLIDLALVKATGSANVQIGGLTWKTARFTRAEIQAATVKTVATDDAAQATVSSLLGQTQLTVNVLGLGLGVGAITSAVQGVLTAAAAPLDGVINGLTQLLGVRLGEADVRVNGLRCRDAALVA